jgi:hypothetical protein
MDTLYLGARVRPDGVDITVIGPLTALTTAQLRATLGTHRCAATRLRLRTCTALDLDGLCALLLAHIEAGESGGTIHLLDVPPLIEHYLRLHHAGHLLAPGTAPVKSHARVPRPPRGVATHHSEEECPREPPLTFGSLTKRSPD